MVLIGYNGIIDKPGKRSCGDRGQPRLRLLVALLCAIAIAATGFLRSQAGQRRERKAPGTV